MDFESKLDLVITPASAMVQLSQSAPGDGTPVPPSDVKKFIIVDAQTRSELLYGMETRVPSNDPDLRGLYITTLTGEPLIQLGYVYRRQALTIEFSTPTGTPICTAHSKLNPLFLGGILLCPCFPCLLCCLCAGVPTIYYKFRNAAKMDLLAVDAYMTRKYIAKSSSGNRSELASIQMAMLSRNDMSCRVVFKPNASRDDKLLLLAFAIGSMDVNRIQESRRRYDII